MPNQDSMGFIIIVVLTKRQNKREQKLKLMWLNSVYFNSKEKRFSSKAWVFAMSLLVRVHKNTSERKQHLQWTNGTTQMLQDFHEIAIWIWLLKPLRYEAEQCSFLLHERLCVSTPVYYAIACCIDYSLVFLTYNFAFGHDNLWRICYINYSNYWETQETSNIWFCILFRIFSEKLQFWLGILIWNHSVSQYFVRTFTQSRFEKKRPENKQ